MAQDKYTYLPAIGDRVVFIDKKVPKHGVVRWLGHLQEFRNELMAGIDYDFPIGQMNGNYRGKQLFSALEDHGAIVPCSGLILEKLHYASANKLTTRQTQVKNVKILSCCEKSANANGLPNRENVGNVGSNSPQVIPRTMLNIPKPIVSDCTPPNQRSAACGDSIDLVELRFMRSQDKTLVGPYTLHVRQSITISTLKDMIQARNKVPRDRQVWIIGHRIPGDNDFLRDLGVWNASNPSQIVLSTCNATPPVPAAQSNAASVSVSKRETGNIKLCVTLICDRYQRDFPVHMPSTNSKKDLAEQIIATWHMYPSVDGWIVNGKSVACDDAPFASCGIGEDARIFIPCSKPQNKVPENKGAIPKLRATLPDTEKPAEPEQIVKKTVYNIFVEVQSEKGKYSFRMMINRCTKLWDMQCRVLKDFDILPDFQQWIVNERVVKNANSDDLFQSFGTYEDCSVLVRKVETGWSCPACTFINPVTRPGCRECCTERPADYVPPKVVEIDEAERQRLKKEAEAERALKEQAEKDRRQAQEDYRDLLNLDELPVVFNKEEFDCQICMETQQPEDGIILRECLHSFCRKCLADTVLHCNDAYVKCPYFDEYACEAVIQLREIQSIVSEDVFDKLLSKSLKVAESTAENSFHCCTRDCNAWCEYDDNVNEFVCPICKNVNCITCHAIHYPKTCKQYQDWAELHGNSEDSAEAIKSKEFLRGALENGTAMRCPGCKLVIIEKTGCDWVCCPNCRMQICWATKGPRWGPKGPGDTSRGCRCRLNGRPCHPKCQNCH